MPSPGMGRVAHNKCRSNVSYSSETPEWRFRIARAKLRCAQEPTYKQSEACYRSWSGILPLTKGIKISFPQCGKLCYRRQRVGLRSRHIATACRPSLALCPWLLGVLCWWFIGLEGPKACMRQERVSAERYQTLPQTVSWRMAKVKIKTEKLFMKNTILKKEDLFLVLFLV